MHHVSRTTTARYLHSGLKAVGSAIDAMPDLAYPQAQVATGTNGPEANQTAYTADACATACAKPQRPMAVGGGKGSDAEKGGPTINPAKHAGNDHLPGNEQPGLLAELADAMDSKSIARKGVSVRLR